jgi:co-chaperonin GroES (HSP10)
MKKYKILASLLIIALAFVTIACAYGASGTGVCGVNNKENVKTTAVLAIANNKVDSTSGTTLKLGDYILLGKYNDAPILWRYAAHDKNGMLILSDKILCKKMFDVYSDNLLSGDNYWGHSNIRSWLNSSAPAGKVVWLNNNPPVSDSSHNNGYDNEKGFLAAGNFTANERNVIKKVTQKSLLDPLYSDLAKGGSDIWENTNFSGNSFYLQDFVEKKYDRICFEYVTDKIFLLDAKQLWNIYRNSDALGDNYYLSSLTKEGLDNDAFEQYYIKNYGHTSSEKEYTDYYLRTPYGVEQGHGGSAQDLSFIHGDGVLAVTNTINEEICRVDAIDANEDLGIRPAFYLNAGNTVVLSGSGTKDSPYVISGKTLQP